MTLLAFDVSSIAARAIAIENAGAVALIAEIPDGRIDYAYRDGRCHVQCSRDMALCLAESFRVRAASPGESHHVLIACAHAAAAVLAAIDRDVPTARN